VKSNSVKWTSGALWLFKVAVAILVTWGIVRSLDAAKGELADHSFSVTALSPFWIGVAALTYVLGLLPMGCFWYWLLHRMGQSPSWYETMRAYFIGHLGKYVPGKAMVLLLRVGLLRSHRVDATVAAVSVFIETLAMMASGAFLAAGCLVIWFRDQRMLQAVAIGLMLATVAATLPSVLRFVLVRMKKHDDPIRLKHVIQHVNWRTLLTGWIMCWVGWCFLAVSFWATIRAMPDVPVEMQALSFESFARSLASVSLAIVAGFLSLVPGGLGVREWVINGLMVPVLGTATSIIVAILLRVVWLVTELTFSIILYFAPPLGTSSDP